MEYTPWKKKYDDRDIIISIESFIAFDIVHNLTESYTQSDFCGENRNDKYKKMTISQFGEHMLQKNKFYLNEMV